MGFIDRIRKTNITRNAFTVMAQITILCSLIVTIATVGTSPSGEHRGMTFVTTGALLVTAITFITWLLWSIYVVGKHKILRPMEAAGYKILDKIELCLFAYWIVISLFKSAINVWVAPIMAIVWLSALFIAIKYRAAKASTADY